MGKYQKALTGDSFLASCLRKHSKENKRPFCGVCVHIYAHSCASLHGCMPVPAGVCQCWDDLLWTGGTECDHLGVPSAPEEWGALTVKELEEMRTILQMHNVGVYAILSKRAKIIFSSSRRPMVHSFSPCPCSAYMSFRTGLWSGHSDTLMPRQRHFRVTAWGSKASLAQAPPPE